MPSWLPIKHCLDFTAIQLEEICLMRCCLAQNNPSNLRLHPMFDKTDLPVLRSAYSRIHLDQYCTSLLLLFLHTELLQSSSKRRAVQAHAGMDALNADCGHESVHRQFGARTQSGIIRSFAKSPPPITFPARAVDMATDSSELKKLFT